MICDLCKRNVNNLTKHHLIPKSRGGAKGDTIQLCLSCKDMVHILIDNKQLEREYNTLEKLLSNEKIIKYVKWIYKQKKEKIPLARKKRKK